MLLAIVMYLKHRIKMNKKGFTLIELLTTMTIIAVLLGLALVSFQGARKSARDGKRKADLEQIRSALEMCYADDNQYPGSITGNVTCVVSNRTYLDPTPTDPSTGEDYYYDSPTGAYYTLCATLEVINPYEDSCGAEGNYEVTNP